MIYYDISSFQDIIDEHFNELQTYLNNRIAESTLNVPIKQFIIDNLQDIIKSNPTELKRLNDELKNHKRFSVNLNNKIKKIFNYKYFFIKDIFPIVKSQIENVELVIVGDISKKVKY